MLPPQPHLQYGYRWILVHDNQGVLKGERQRYNAAGEHLVGYPHIDHTHGLSMYVRLFCQKTMLGGLKVTADLWAQKIGLIIRYDTMSRCSLSLLTDDQIRKLSLPAKAEMLDAYENKDVEPLRALELLHPLRAPGFPDDVKFIMSGKGFKTEQVWGRLERRLNDTLFECTLLNAPHQDFGVKAGERVVVLIARAQGGIASQFVAPLSTFVQSPPPDNEQP